jgi:hypothetical protein
MSRVAPRSSKPAEDRVPAGRHSKVELEFAFGFAIGSRHAMLAAMRRRRGLTLDLRYVSDSSRHALGSRRLISISPNG